MRELRAGPVQRFLGGLRLRHILEGTDEHRPPVHVLRDVRDRADMLHVPAGGNDAVGETHVQPRHGAFERRFEHRQIIGVNDVSDRLQGNLRRWTELEDAQGFVGPLVVVPDQVRDEAARLAQSLSVGKAVVGAPELGLRPLSVLDIGVDAVPFGDVSGLVAQRIGTEEKPPIFAVMPTQSRLCLSRRFRSQDALPRRRQSVPDLQDGRQRSNPTRSPLPPRDR